MQIPHLQFIKSIPTWGARLYEALNAVQQQTTRIETQGNLNATGSPPVPPPPDALNVTTGPSGEFQIAITHNGEFNRGTTFHTQWDTSPHFTNPHNIDHGSSRNDSSLNLPGQTVYFRSSAASPNGANSTWTYHGSQNNPAPVLGGVAGVRAPGMGSGTGAPGDQSGGPGPVQSRNSESGYRWKAQQRGAGSGFGAPGQGGPAGGGMSTGTGGGGLVGALIIVDTYANWTTAKYPPANYPTGTIFVISNRNNIQYQVQSGSWNYLEGTYAVTQPSIAGLRGFSGGALGGHDTGLLINVTDYGHVLQWGGSAFGWGPGDTGSGYLQDFAVAPTAVGYVACTGGSATYLTATGGTASVTLPATSSTPAYRLSTAGYSATITTAKAPQISGHTETGTANITDTPVTINNPAAGGTPASVATSDTEVDSGHTHNLDHANAPISLAAGDPIANYPAITYFRI